MSDSGIESLIEDIAAILATRQESAHASYPALESALLLGFARPALLSVWQIASSLLREAFKTAGLANGAWCEDDLALLEHLGEVITSTRMRTIANDLAALALESRKPETESQLLIEQAHDAVEDLLGLIGWLQARKLLETRQVQRDFSTAVSERVALLIRIYRTIGFDEITQREMSSATAYILLGRVRGARSEYIQVFVSDDLAELEDVLADESLTNLTEQYKVSRTLIIADSPLTALQERLSTHGEIKSFAAFIADLLNYREYIAHVRHRLGVSVLSVPVTLKAELLQFDEVRQTYTITRITNVEVATSEELSSRAGNLLILADSGGGKTFLCEQILERILTGYENCFVVYFHLGEWPSHMPLSEFLALEMSHFSNLPLPELTALFTLLGGEGYIVCLLDAFDEGVQSSHMEEVLLRFADISELFTGRSRIVLTSRISFFQSTPELRQLLHSGAMSSEKVSHTLTATGIDPLALPNFRVMRLRRIPVDIGERKIELTPLEMQLLLSMAPAERRDVIFPRESRIVGSLLIENELLRLLPTNRGQALLDDLANFFGEAYQEGRTTFEFPELRQLGGGVLFTCDLNAMEACLLSDMLRITGDNKVRFRHLAYQEYLFARQLATTPSRVRTGTPVSSPVRRFLHELMRPSLPDPRCAEPILPAEQPFVVGTEDRSCIARVKECVRVQYETVTVSEYKRFLEDIAGADIREFEHPAQPAGHTHTPPTERLKIKDYYDAEEYADYPATCISWWSAYTYAAFHGGRLLTANEWEFAARGPDGRLFPWGDEVELGRANSADYWARQSLLTWEEWKAHFDSSGIRGGLPLPTNQFPNNISPFGILGLAGNIWEWIGTTNARFTRAGIMGASYDNPFRALRSSVRCFNETAGLSNAIGFRWCEVIK